MKPSVKYGLVVASTGILLSLIIYIIGLDKTDTGKYLGWLNIPIMIVLMVVAIKETREKFFGGYISFGQAFKTVAVMVVISAAITAVYTYFYFTAINPSMVDYIHEQQYAEFLDQGMSDQEIERAMQMSSKFTSPGAMTIWTFVGGTVIGLIIGAIVSAIVKKPDPNRIS